MGHHPTTGIADGDHGERELTTASQGPGMADEIALVGGGGVLDQQPHGDIVGLVVLEHETEPDRYGVASIAAGTAWRKARCSSWVRAGVPALSVVGIRWPPLSSKHRAMVVRLSTAGSLWRCHHDQRGRCGARGRARP